MQQQTTTAATGNGEMDTYNDPWNAPYDEWLRRQVKADACLDALQMAFHLMLDRDVRERLSEDWLDARLLADMVYDTQYGLQRAA